MAQPQLRLLLLLNPIAVQSLVSIGLAMVMFGNARQHLLVKEVASSEISPASVRPVTQVKIVPTVHSGTTEPQMVRAISVLSQFLRLFWQ
jgi:hypothetical protein